VRVSDEEGLTGVGEADAPARIVRTRRARPRVRPGPSFVAQDFFVAFTIAVLETVSLTTER
jgi:hypothetical protein